MKKITKITTALMLTMTLLLGSSAVTAQTKSFKDVNEEKYSWAIESIRFMNDKGVIKGYSDGTFKPDQAVTKAEFVTLSAKLFDKFKPNRDTNANYWKINKFLDVPKSYWAYKYINDTIYVATWDTYSSSNKGFKFYPDTKLTRIGAAKLLPAIFGEIQDSSEALSIIRENMSDIKIIDESEYKEEDGRYNEANDRTNAMFPLIISEGYFSDDSSAITGTTLATLQKLGLMTASEGKFAPRKLLTRAEAATTLHRLYQYLKENGDLKKYSSK
ncbi:S-layer homology domain-containing protein [Cohnella mopanensis]|uniref:S-layer homology domain-containing protein n=1 Tax=Cohnella mopanensis TaxID=2911966 RepID=UPI001EF7AB2B|nr:S-layer homology domain-containing protein [Cohnella mopanensis]